MSTIGGPVHFTHAQLNSYQLISARPAARCHVTTFAYLLLCRYNHYIYINIQLYNFNVIGTLAICAWFAGLTLFSSLSLFRVHPSITSTINISPSLQVLLSAILVNISPSLQVLLSAILVNISPSLLYYNLGFVVIHLKVT